MATVPDLIKHMKKAKIILTTDCDLTENYKKIIEENEEVGYFRSVVVISREDYDNINTFMNEDPDIPGVQAIDEVKSEHDSLIDDFVNFGGFERATIVKILKGFESETLSKKVSLISEHCKKESEKKAKEEEKKKKEEKDKKKPVEESKEGAPKEELKEGSTIEMSSSEPTPGISPLSSEISLEKTESNSKQPEEEKKEEEKKPEDVKINDDPDTIFGLFEEDKLVANIATLKN